MLNYQRVSINKYTSNFNQNNSICESVNQNLSYGYWTSAIKNRCHLKQPRPIVHIHKYPHTHMGRHSAYTVVHSWCQRLNHPCMEYFHIFSTPLPHLPNKHHPTAGTEIANAQHLPERPHESMLRHRYLPLPWSPELLPGRWPVQRRSKKNIPQGSTFLLVNAMNKIQGLKQYFWGLGWAIGTIFFRSTSIMNAETPRSLEPCPKQSWK